MLQIAKTYLNNFWKDVLKHYIDFNKKCQPKDYIEFIAECIFWNENITIDQNSIFFKSWADAGIIQVHQLIREGMFLSYENFMNLYPGITVDFVTYHGVLQAVKQFMRKKGFVMCNKDSVGDTTVWKYIAKGNRVVRSILDNPVIEPACVRKWSLSFDNLEWNKIFNLSYMTTRDSQLRWFQIKLLHRLIPTNRYLHMRRLKDNAYCTFCDSEEENLMHLFWNCRFSMSLWKDLESLLHNMCTHCSRLTFSQKLIVFGVEEGIKTDTAMDFIILFAKFYIFKCKILGNKPYIAILRKELKNRYVIERKTCEYEHRSKFDMLWFPYLKLLDV